MQAVLHPLYVSSNTCVSLGRVKEGSGASSVQGSCRCKRNCVRVWVSDDGLRLGVFSAKRDTAECTAKKPRGPDSTSSQSDLLQILVYGGFPLAMGF